MSLRTLIIVATLVLATAVERAGAAEIWFSDTLIDDITTGGAPWPPNDLQKSYSNAGGTGRLYLWTTLAPAKTLKNWSLEIESINKDLPANNKAPVTFRIYQPPPGSQVEASPNVYNKPLIKLINDPTILNPHRWEYTTTDYEPTEQPTAPTLVNIGGVSITGATQTGVGIGQGGGGGPNFADTLYDRVHKAWLLASVEYEIASAGEVEISLRSGAWGMSYSDSTAATFVFWKAQLSIAPPAVVDPDFDGNGVVDGADLLAWKSGFGIRDIATHAAGDANSDGSADGADFLAWQQRLGPVSAGSAAAAPEPSSACCAAMVVAGLVAAVRRRRPRDVTMAFRSDTKRRALRQLPARRARSFKQLAWVVAATLCSQAPVEAATYRWKSAVSGSFADPAMWDPAGGPGGPGDVVLFNAPALPANRYTVAGVDGDHFQLQAASGSMTLEIADMSLLSTGTTSPFGLDASVVIGIGPVAADVVLTGGPGSLLNTRQTNIAVNTTSNGVLSVRNLEWVADGALVVGFFGAGTLDVADGSEVASAGGQIGRFGAATGLVMVHGVGSSWTNSGSLNVGNSDNTSGTLAITDGGRVENLSGVVGLGKGVNSTGIVNVVGDDSTLTVSSELRIGQGGQGMLTINEGAAAETASAFIGDASKGQVVVDGDDSQWINSAQIVVGNSPLSDGKLTVKRGGDVTSSSAVIGQASGAKGATAVVGAGSNLETTGLLAVGGSGAGALSVSSGARAASARADIGVEVSGIGSVTVSGAGASWVNSADLRVGAAGDGTLLVLGGGAATSASASVATGASSSGNVLVNGSGSTWTTGRLGIGGDVVANAPGGTASVAVQSGANVTVSQGAVVFPSGVLRVDGGAFQAATLENRGVVELKPAGVLRAMELTNAGGGVVRGTGHINGHLINRGRVAPGFSPGIINVDGDFTQQANGVLDIEVGGPAPGTQHDKVIVSGAATLGGRLDVTLIDNYVPVANGPAITFLEAQGVVTGRFDSIFAPSVAALNPEVALRVVGAPGNPTTRQLQFVQPVTGNQLGNQPVVDWSSPGNWTTGVPDTAHVINLQNATGAPQQVNVVSDNAFVHRLAVGGGVGDLTFAVQNGKSLSAIDGVTVGNHGAIELDAGTLVASTVQIVGGSLAGNGTLVGDVTVGAGGVVGPGFSIGTLRIEGKFQATADGQTTMEIANIEDFDKIQVNGEATPGGTLMVDLTGYTEETPRFYPVLQAETITPGAEFDRFLTTGAPPGYYVAPVYGKDVAGVFVSNVAPIPGDLNHRDRVTPDDAYYMAMAFVNTDLYEQMFAEEFGNFSYEGVGDVNDRDGFTFDDIQAFVDLLNSLDLIAPLILGEEPRGVPEPGGFALGILAVVGFAQRRLTWRHHLRA